MTCAFVALCDLITTFLPLGAYSLIEEPTLELSTTLVKQGDLPNPSLGSIIVNWFDPDREL